MHDSLSDAGHQSVFVRSQEHPFFHPDAGLFPGATLAQRFQSSHTSSNCFHGMNARFDLDSMDCCTCIGLLPDISRIQSHITRWGESGMGQCPLHSTSSELAVSSWSEIKLLRTEALSDQPGIPPIPSPISAVGIEDSASESLSQAGCASPSQECYTLWKKVPLDVMAVTGSNDFVPQALYKPLTEADKERYLERVSLSAPIIFVTKKSLECGISLEDVRNGKLQHLIDKDDPVLQDCGPSVSVRINWPGYPSFKRQISSRNWRKMKGPITKERLVQYLATTTGRFIEKMSNRQMQVGAETSWKVGPQHIRLEDLILVSLHHASKGSWQPQFRLRRSVV